MALRVRRRRQAEEPVSVGFKPPRKTSSKVAIGLCVAVLAASIGLAGYVRAANEQFYPGTRIGGVLIGSRSADEAEGLLHDRYVLPLHRTITISAADYKFKTSPWDLGMRLDVNDIVRDALVRQQAEPVATRFWHRVFGTTGSVRVRPDVNEAMFTSVMHKTFKEIDQTPVDARLEVNDGKLHVIPHKLGRQVEDDVAEHRVFEGMLQGVSKVELPVSITQPTLKSTDFAKVIVVSTGANTLKLYKHGKLAKQYAVATGTGGYPTPHGQFRITVKRFMPTWYNPHAPWSTGMPEYISPGPNNPLGTRALNLDASGIRIHGTPEDDSIGSNASHGCIRMHIHEAEQLYDMVDVNTPVLIVY